MPGAAPATCCVDFALPLPVPAHALVALVMAPGAAGLPRVESDRFREMAVVLDGVLQGLLQRYAQATFTQPARNAACNRSHHVRERCARWLLMSADRTHSAEFPLTQESLAQALAVRRASVSEVAAALAEDGCISYRRGVITVTDRARLEANACECYRVIRDTFAAAYPPVRERPEAG
ncbi:Crp/Fnr family transcriptional regulator [Saccharothrix lopnurensis]|uniref:Crp/Fnr family transcriptional regulator n=1 Tax=Saccharothrix lopnurensis TaxID=1670621 RepID=A0ABW1PHE5_9PSEU